MFTPPDQPYTRRVFLTQGLTLASLAATAPLFIQRSAFGLHPWESLLSSQPGVPDDRILVVIQLGGGNDGLNTVVPYGSDDYYRLRPAIAIPQPGRNGNGPAQQGALELDPARGIGLHADMAPFKQLIDDGVASIVQGVGYPNPNRSHFTSMDIWHTASPETGGTAKEGWIGRYFDCTCNGSPVPEGAIAVGREAPLAMVGSVQKPVSFESEELFRWLGEDLHGSLKQPYDQITRSGTLDAVNPDSQLGFLMRTALDAQVSSERIREAVAKRPLVTYPGNPLARQLQIVGALIRDGMKTRVYYVSMGGFDTHAGQLGTHARLLRQFAESVSAFYKDLKAQGNNSRVLTMAFSEFGRRVPQNGSQGTDHGTAAPMYFVGDMIRPGLLGEHPSLTNLEEGDLKFNLDFRSVYSTVLEDWMAAPAAKILGRDYRKPSILRT
jgi:uncharacterized protein (DUF1501 family)